MMDPSQLSKFIRAGKKKIMNAEPEIVDTDAKVDMNPIDVWNTEKTGYIQDMVGSDPKINADETMANEPDDDAIMAEQKKRMGRLSSYFDSLDLDEG